MSISQDFIIFTPDNLPLAYPFYMRQENKDMIDEMGDVIFVESGITGRENDNRLLLNENALTTHINDTDILLYGLSEFNSGNPAFENMQNISIEDIKYIVTKNRILSTLMELITEQNNISPLQKTMYGEDELKHETASSSSRKGKSKQKGKTRRRRKKKTRRRRKKKTRRV
jgi:hypothetical protein